MPPSPPQRELPECIPSERRGCHTDRLAPFHNRIFLFSPTCFVEFVSVRVWGGVYVWILNQSLKKYDMFRPVRFLEKTDFTRNSPVSIFGTAGNLFCLRKYSALYTCTLSLLRNVIVSGQQTHPWHPSSDPECHDDR